MAFPDSFTPGRRRQLSTVHFFSPGDLGSYKKNEKSWFNIKLFINANSVFVARLREVALKMGGT